MNKPDSLLLSSSENKVEAIRQFVQTLCIFNFRNVTGRELDLLCEILRCQGVNDKAKQSFLINYKTTKENYGQLIKRLSDKEILLNNEKRNGKQLHPTFLKFLDLYINDRKCPIMFLQWKSN